LHDRFSLSRVMRYDTAEVHSAYEEWPSLAGKGFAVRAEALSGRYRRVSLLGMGGSAAAGDIIRGWLSGRQGLEFDVYKGHIPLTDMRDTVAIACSASGGTEETIEMMKTAMARGANVVCISSGGKLRDVAIEEGVPYIKMPEIKAPRYMLPFIIFACVSLCNEVFGLGCEQECREAIEEMERVAPGLSVRSPAGRNRAKRLASSLIGRVPKVYGTVLTRGVAVRFKNALNENAKKHASFDVMPELFHNEVEAWEGGRGRFVPVFLSHTMDSKRESRKAERMKESLKRLGADPITVSGSGVSSLAQLASMTYVLDYTSYYCAIGLGRDPFPTRLIDTIKSEG